MSKVLYSEDGRGVGRLTLNDPDLLNAMNEEMAAEFQALVESKMKSPPRVLVLSGAGRAFSAGGDLKMLLAKTAIDQERNRQLMLDFYRAFLSIRRLPCPVIAAINGHAIGAGLCLAAACDVRISSSLSKLGMTFAKLGLHPGMGATYFLPRIIGISRATELMLTAKVLSATEGECIGLVSKVVEPALLEDAVNQVVAELLGAGPLVLEQLLVTMRGDTRELDMALGREASCQAINYAGAEFAEGVRAAMEKRSPSFARK